jgi:asparagine synthase (glutamine-hydrolysing)
VAGIAGWITPARHAGDENALDPMAAALSHRTRGGPGLSGVVDMDQRRQVVLGATLCDEPAGISLVLDGVIANARELRAQLAKRGYHFAGESAEELLLRAYQDWDKDLVKHLRGAFAFALWDARKDRLLIARDRFGEKPLYLHERNGAVYFASEIKALLKAGVQAKADPAALWDCLAHRYVPGPRTLFAGIRKLAPATYGLWQFGKLREVRYWIPPDRNPYVKNGGGKDTVEGFVDSLEESVKLHSGSGVLLSGGLDSSVLVALMSRNGAKPHTFSLGFEGDKASELAHAAQLAKHYGTAHQEIVIAPRDLIPSLAKLVAQRDAPVSRASDLAVHRLACEAGRVTKTVVTGDGCDEVLGGYRRYVAERMSGGVEGFPARLLAPLVSAGRFDSAAASLKLQGWRDTLSTLKGGPTQAQSDADPRASRLRRALYIDQTGSLPDQLLERNDHLTMAASVEARMPFLDHRLVEYVSALPDEQRVRGLTTKWILRQAARELIPAALRRRPKGGWRLDVAAWLRNDLKDLTLDHLQGRSSVTRRYYDAATLDRVLEEHLQGKKNHETLLWTLLNIEIWHRTYTPG